jgi:mannose-6-phosphate isomerase
MNDHIYPLTFEPVLKAYLWGGRNLEKMLGRTLPEGKVAESWEISGHPSAPTLVKNGPLAGKTLPDVLGLLGTGLVGSRSQAMLARGKFPLLVKLLDANEPLSVQVHPDDEYARTHENGELGKTEMWYILHADEGARLIYGLKPGVTPESFRQALAAGRLEECLHYLPVQAGDAVFIPAGSLHAVLEGIVLTEIQQNSDTTYRVYDWNRVDADGKPRSLHLEKALVVTNFDQVEPGPYRPQLLSEDGDLRREIITSSAYFVVERLTFKRAGGSFLGQCDGQTMEIWGNMSGQGRVNWSGQPLNLPAVQYALLPAALGAFEVEAVTRAVMLRVYISEA